MLSTSKNALTLLVLCLFSFTTFAQSNVCPSTEAQCEGQKTFENGDVYNGQFAYGILTGEGLMKFANGDEYLGTFKNGKMDGTGTILLSSGDSYQGTWKSGEAHGMGTYSKKDGNSYIGNFKSGMREGEGLLVWSNGDTLRGTWSDDRLQGEAIFDFANGDKLETKWHQGSMKVKSTYHKPDGKAIHGSMNTIFMVATMEDELAGTKDEIVNNLQTAWISSAMEFQANRNYDLAVDFLMAAQTYGPADSDNQTVIAQQMKAIDNAKNNSGWAQLPKK